MSTPLSAARRPVGLLLTLGLLLLPLLAAPRASAATHRQERPAMGSPFAVTAVAPDDETARRATAAAFAEIDRIEALISSWRETSETSAVNRAAGHGPVEVSDELFELLRRALAVGKVTGGAFDVTFAGAGRLWDFQDPTPALPDPEQLRQALARVDYRRVRLDAAHHTVELPEEGMRLGFGGIGKGYAANRAVEALRAAGATAGLVDAGGDLLAFGDKEDGRPWTIVIADPLHPDEVFARLDLTDRAVVTSGDYERYVTIDGVRYSHILDPRTGWPARGVSSATVIAPDAELADALATATFVLGVDEGLTLIDHLRGVEAVLVDDAGKLHPSRGIDTRRVGVEEN